VTASYLGPSVGIVYIYTPPFERHEGGSRLRLLKNTGIAAGLSGLV
jgi:hypothetical protein